jgi:hypothetical protein
MSNDLERRVELIYNEYKFDFQFKSKEKIGKIQEDILSKVSLMIYNIECTKVFFEEGNEYILGDEKMLFLDKWDKFEEREDIKMKKIEKIVVYDRRRDEKGNVIKENKIIEQFNRYIQCEETERYIEQMNRPNFMPPPIPLQHSNITFHQGSFAQSLMSDLLRPEFLRGFQNTVFSTPLGVTPPRNQQEQEESIPQDEETPHEVEEEKEENTQEEERTEEENSNIENIIENELSSLVNVVNEYVERRRRGDQVRVRLSGILNENPLLQQFETNLLNEMNNPFLNISIETSVINNQGEGEVEVPDREDEETKDEEVEEVEEEVLEEESDHQQRPIYSANNILFGQPRIVRFPLHDPSILQNNASMEVLENLMTSLFGTGHFEFGNGQGGFYDDVKVCLSEEDFESQLEHFVYQDSENNEEENRECIICTDAFKEGDSVSKTCCGHLFHDECLKPWLLNQSVKCPVCRTEVGKGKPKN